MSKSDPNKDLTTRSRAGGSPKWIRPYASRSKTGGLLKGSTNMPPSWMVIYTQKMNIRRVPTYNIKSYKTSRNFKKTKLWKACLHER
jgi:hypothetical protein